MRVVVDSAIPFLCGVLEPYCNVDYVPGQAIDNHHLVDCDALIIRTRTRCTRELLEGSAVKFIATATIGRDHIDEEYCTTHDIEVFSAAGCNARGVLQWVAASLRHIATMDNRPPESYTLGVVGVGNVGSLVADYAELWGFRVMRCDPPRAAREGGLYYPIEQLASECDILTLHTPLDSTTHHLVDAKLLKSMKPEAIVINASRGAVVDNRAMVDSNLRYIFDVWEHEPNIMADTLSHATLSTPHIAGYSLQGKANATAMVVRALAKKFDLPLTDWYPSDVERSRPKPISWEEMCSSIDAHCDINRESATLKASPESFEALRNNYLYRKEYF